MRATAHHRIISAAIKRSFGSFATEFRVVFEIVTISRLARAFG